MSVSRPASARPRSNPPDGGGAAPTSDELAAIEEHRVVWAGLLAAAVESGPAGSRWLVRHEAPGSSLNFLAGVRWSDADFDERLAGASKAMTDRGMWPSLIVCEGLTTPAEISLRLVAARWLPVSSERIMWTRHPAVVPHLDPSLRVEAVTPATALDAVRLETEVFGLIPEAMGESAELLAHAVSDGTTRAFVLRLRGEPVATARLVPGPTVAGLHAIAVAGRQRRRGYGRMLTAIATRAGLATGHKLVWLSVDEDNAAAVALYRSVGFEPAFSWTRWIAPA